MSDAKAALLRAAEICDETTTGVEAPAGQRREGLRHHVINRMSQERSGRLYSPFDWDFEIPSLEVYAAR